MVIFLKTAADGFCAVVFLWKTFARRLYVAVVLLRAKQRPDADIPLKTCMYLVCQKHNDFQAEPEF